MFNDCGEPSNRIQSRMMLSHYLRRAVAVTGFSNVQPANEQRIYFVPGYWTRAT